MRERTSTNPWRLAAAIIDWECPIAGGVWHCTRRSELSSSKGKVAIDFGAMIF
jgi:hypothetical protein